MKQKMMFFAFAAKWAPGAALAVREKRLLRASQPNPAEVR
jgi:hypothetical protein